jgi:hypothetical protein
MAEKSFTSLILSLLNIVLGAYGVYKILHDDSTFSTYLYLIVSFTLWVFLIFLFFRKEKKKSSIGYMGDEPFELVKKNPYYSKSIRRFALIGIIVFPILISFILIYPQIKSKKTIIVVSDYDGLDPQKYRVTDIILEKLHKLAQEFKDIDIVFVPEKITEKNGTQYARRIGVKKKSIDCNLGLLWCY